MSCVPNGEQYCLLLGDLSTVQNLSCPGVMKCNVLESWVQSLFHEELVMTEVKKPSNATLVLSSAATALQNKDHQPTYWHSFIWSTVHLSNSGKLSLIISVKTVSTKYTSRSNRKFLTVDVSSMKNLFIWSHLSVALFQGATFSTVSFFFLCRWGRFLSLMSTLAFTKWQQRHHMVSTLLGHWPGYNKQCRADVVQKLKAGDHGKGPLSPSWPPPPFLEQVGCSALTEEHRERIAPGCWQYEWCPHPFTRWAATGEKGLRATCALCNYLSLTICIKWLHSAVEWGTLLSWRQIPALRSASFMSVLVNCKAREFFVNYGVGWHRASWARQSLSELWMLQTCQAGR